MSFNETCDPEVFDLLKQLGAGGFAYTWLAKVVDEEWIEEYDTQQVALKVPSSSRNQRILNHEVELNAALYLRLKTLNSENLCRYLGFNVYRGKIVMVMEYCSDGSLRGKIGGAGRRIRRVPVDEAVEIAIGVLKGLAAIHAQHVFHRDIKPENILFSGNTPKIADLGISKIITSHQKAVTSAGTIPYMSPEILGKAGASFTSDLWSLGVTLYEMTTGILPFGDWETPTGQMIDMIRDEAHRPVCDICKDLPSWFSGIIDTALQKQPEDRFPSAEAMIEALLHEGDPSIHRRKSVAEEAKPHQVPPAKQKMDALDADVERINGMMKAGESSEKVSAEICLMLQKHRDDPRAHHHAGEFYNRSQQHRKAADIFRGGIAIFPGNGLLHWDLAVVCHLMRETQEAIRNLEKALTLDLEPGRKMHAMQLLKTLRPSVKLDEYASSRSVPVNTDESKSDFARLIELMQTGRSGKDVEDELLRFVEKYQTNARAYQYLGEYYNRCQLHEQAIEVFQKGLKLDQSNAMLHWDMAIAHQRLGNRQKAIAHIEMAISLNLDAGLCQHANVLLRALRG